MGGDTDAGWGEGREDGIRHWGELGRGEGGEIEESKRGNLVPGLSCFSFFFFLRSDSVCTKYAQQKGQAWKSWGWGY